MKEANWSEVGLAFTCFAISVIFNTHRYNPRCCATGIHSIYLIIWTVPCLICYMCSTMCSTMCWTMSSQYSHNVFCTHQCPQCAQQCPQCTQQCSNSIPTMYFVLNNVLRSVEQCHYTYVTQFRPTQEEVLSCLFCICICICVWFLFVFVPVLYLYLCQVCTENFRKRCQISFKQQAFNETVTFKILKIFIV